MKVIPISNFINNDNGAVQNLQWENNKNNSKTLQLKKLKYFTVDVSIEKLIIRN